MGRRGQRGPRSLPASARPWARSPRRKIRLPLRQGLGQDSRSLIRAGEMAGGESGQPALPPARWLSGKVSADKEHLEAWQERSRSGDNAEMGRSRRARLAKDGFNEEGGGLRTGRWGRPFLLLLL